MTQGATPNREGVHYSFWAPGSTRVEVEIHSPEGALLRTLDLATDENGFFSNLDPLGLSGDLYKLRRDGGSSVPAPASHYQPQGVHGPSQVIDHTAFPWTDQAWHRPPFRDLIIYELHVGTFSPEGTFRGAIEKLPYLRELGVTALEIMPIADFPGRRGWGYDGVQLFAPANCYGSPDDFKAFVDAAHAHGIAIVLDVVYNHFGPDGNYLLHFSPHYLEQEDKTPWGSAINFGRDHAEPVRAFYRQNLLLWIEAYHIDGFRFDATHAIADVREPHILCELTGIARRNGCYTIAEDERNDARLITPAAEGGFGFDAVWADDFHHVIEVALMRASSRYLEDFLGDLPELVSALQHGWVYRGQAAKRNAKARGTPADHLPPERFVFCISNHDQIGNRAFGERLNHYTNHSIYRAASALLLLSPYTPMLFQGQEWGASTPFLYFTDHNEELGRLVEAGRREEMEFAIHAAGGGDIPGPQAEETFRRSILNWSEPEEGEHARTLRLYQDALRLRREFPCLRPPDRTRLEFGLASDVLAMRTWGDPDLLLLCDLVGGCSVNLGETRLTTAPDAARWRVLFHTSEPAYGGTGARRGDGPVGAVEFHEPALVLLQAASD